MNKLLLTTACILCVSTTSTFAQNWSAELYGGLRISDDLNYNTTSFPVDTGPSIGAAIYRRNLLPNWDFGVDFSLTRADYAGFTTSVKSTAMIAMARYNFPTAGPISFYGSAGVGVIKVRYDGAAAFPAFTGQSLELGGQVGLGVGYKVGDLTLFSEVRYQGTFDDAIIRGQTVEYNSTSILLGARFGF